MTREEALQRFTQAYGQYGKAIGDEEMNDFNNYYNQSAEAGLYSGPGYGQSLESLMGVAAARAKERFMSTADRAVDSNSREGEALYGGRPEDRVTSGSGPAYVDPDKLKGFAPFAFNADPAMIQSLFSSQMGKMGNNTGFTGRAAGPIQYAPTAGYGNPYAGGGQQSQPGIYNATQTRPQSSMGLTNPAARRSAPIQGGQQTVRNRLNAQTGLGLT